jgi:hypothetical protein
MNDGQSRAKPRRTASEVHPDALLAALVLAPRTFARNRFFGLFEEPVNRRIRRRARHVRGVVRQLTATGKERALVTGRAELEDDRVLLRYRIESLALDRTTALSALESALLSYAMHRSGGGELAEEERARVEEALKRLGPDLALDVGTG